MFFFINVVSFRASETYVLKILKMSSMFLIINLPKDTIVNF